MGHRRVQVGRLAVKFFSESDSPTATLLESSTTINDPRHSRIECDMGGEKKRPIQMDTLLYRRWILHFDLQVGVSTYGGFNMMSKGQILSCCTYRGISKMHEAQFGSNTDSYKLTPPVTRMKKSDTIILISSTLFF